MIFFTRFLSYFLFEYIVQMDCCVFIAVGLKDTVK